MEALFLASLILLVVSVISKNPRTVLTMGVANAVIIVGSFLFVFAFRGLGRAMGSTAGVDQALVQISIYGSIAIGLSAARLIFLYQKAK